MIYNNDIRLWGDIMKIKYLGTAAAEGIPAVFCECETCKTREECSANELFSNR